MIKKSFVLLAALVPMCDCCFSMDNESDASSTPNNQISVTVGSPAPVDRSKNLQVSIPSSSLTFNAINSPTDEEIAAAQDFLSLLCD